MRCVLWLQGHVIKAACSTLTDDVANGLEVCKKYNKGHCAPFSKGDRTCGSAQYADINQSICKETDDSFQCASETQCLYTYILGYFLYVTPTICHRKQFVRSEQ